MLQHVGVVINGCEDKRVIVRVFVLFRVRAVRLVLPVDEQSFYESVAGTTWIAGKE